MPDEHAPGAGDELRPVTVLFADVVGSTALGEALAPDEVKTLIGECVTRMSRAAEDHGGTVQAYMGDGICVYFGVPSAHEDDPERAARAALRIVGVIGEYARDLEAAWGISEFNVRVGINSGQTAVGLVGAADPQAVALGDATNVAARLQSAAQPGDVVVGEATAARLAQRFELEPLGDVVVKGRIAPVKAWRLSGPKPSRRRPATPLVGRDADVDRLVRVRDELLAAGRGQVLFIAGEAGIGKTRMLAELRELLGEEATWLEGQCVSYGGQAAGPFVEVLRGWLGVEERDPEVVVRTKARARLAPAEADSPDLFSPLARLLRLRLADEGAERLQTSTGNVAGAIRAAYRAWVESLARERPVVLALEDVHWADAATRELAEELLALTDHAPLVLACTIRGSGQGEGAQLRLRALADYGHRVTELHLQPIGAGDAAHLLDLLVPTGLDADAKGEIVRRAEGNPLYVEELLQTLIEGGALQRRRTWTLTVRAESVLPPVLENILVARIDLLPPGPRRLAHLAAAIGRHFNARVLERLAGPAAFEDDLAVLLRAEIVRELRRDPEREYTFKHGLLQEAALSTLPPARRRELYAQVAAAFEEIFAASLEQHLEVLAHYYAQSENLPKALEYLERAAEAAATVDATEAAQLARRARELAARLGDSTSASSPAGPA